MIVNFVEVVNLFSEPYEHPKVMRKHTHTHTHTQREREREKES